jgi:formamidopyrimidine-DNA glycosylase
MVEPSICGNFLGMPELPEVETVRRRISPHLTSKRLLRARLGAPKMLEVGDLDVLEGLEFQAPERIGKYLLLPMTGLQDKTLVLHLGMTGQLTFAPPDAVVSDRFRRLPSGYQKPLGVHSEDNHTHLVLDLSDGSRLLFRDPRRFGRILSLDTQNRLSTPRLSRLGPDALGITNREFSQIFRDCQGRRNVKTILLDQSFLAGIGNIYADESCHTAGIHPTTLGESLSNQRLNRLAQAVSEALERGILNAGTTFRDFVHPDGSQGSNQEDLRVYSRAGQPCLRCKTILVKSVVAQRGTVACPKCQK